MLDWILIILFITVATAYLAWLLLRFIRGRSRRKQGSSSRATLTIGGKRPGR